MAIPEIIGSIRSTYTRTVCMVCEEKGIEYVLTEKPLHAPEIFEVIDAVMPAVREQIGVLDKAVTRTGYLVDEQFTFADINLLPILHIVRQLPEGAEAVAAAPHLARYYDRHAARPSFRSTIPPPGPPARAKAR